MVNQNRHHDHHRVPYSSRFHTLGKVRHIQVGKGEQLEAPGRVHLVPVLQYQPHCQRCHIHPHRFRFESTDSRSPQFPRTTQEGTWCKPDSPSPGRQNEHPPRRSYPPKPRKHSSARLLSSPLTAAKPTALPGISFPARPYPPICRPGPLMGRAFDQIGTSGGLGRAWCSSLREFLTVESRRLNKFSAS